MINEQVLKGRLQTIAKEKEIPFNSCWKQLLLERFLAWLERSAYTDKLIFKGDFLLAYMLKIGRGDRNLWIADHGFLKPTYHKAWGDHIDYLKGNFRFYGGSSENRR